MSPGSPAALWRGSPTGCKCRCGAASIPACVPPGASWGQERGSLSALLGGFAARQEKGLELEG